MKIAVSALAWNEEEANSAYSFLEQEEIKYVELVPGRIHSQAEESERLKRYSLVPVAFQALLYGTNNLHLFRGEDERAALRSHLLKTAELASKMSIKKMIFGSPSNRWIDQNLFSFREAEQIALEFFSSLNSIFRELGVELCLEPNPKIYQCNFLTDTPETAIFLTTLSCTNVKLNLDLGAVCINHENMRELLVNYGSLISHIHVSEPQLGQILSHTSVSIHEDMSKALLENASKLQIDLISIEMKKAGEEWMGLKAAIDFVKRCYGS